MTVVRTGLWANDPIFLDEHRVNASLLREELIVGAHDILLHRSLRSEHCLHTVEPQLLDTVDHCLPDRVDTEAVVAT